MRTARRWWWRCDGGVALAHAGLLFALWPASPQPFSAPKLWLLGVCGAGALLASLLRARAGPRLVPALALAWLGLLLASALGARSPAPGAIALDAGAALLCLGLATTAGSVRGPLRALALLGAVEALVVLAQAAGLDPLSVLSPHAPGRLRAYGTLGNPDFVAAWLGASLWLAAAEARAARDAASRGRWLAATLAQLSALAALRSFASLLGLAAGALFAMLALRAARPPLRGEGAAAQVPLAAALALALLCGGLSGRAPGRALAGRIHLWSTGAQALREAPLFGYGPGAVALLQPGWEAARFESGAATAAERSFAGAQDHLHQDLLERSLEQGLPGASVFLLLVAAGLRAAWRGAGARGSGLTSGAPLRFAAAGAAIASLAARGLVDFPAARPAELALLVTLIALCARGAAQRRQGPRSAQPAVTVSATSSTTPPGAAALPTSSPSLLGSPP